MESELKSEVIRSASTRGRVYCELCGRLANKADMVGKACSDCKPFGEVIYSYTREQAIADGVLVDINAISSAAGIKFPVAMTNAVFVKCIESPEANGVIKSSMGHLFDMASQLRVAITKGLRSSSTIFFEFKLKKDAGGIETFGLKSVCGPGDSGEPVITIMFPEED